MFKFLLPVLWDFVPLGNTAGLGHFLDWLFYSLIGLVEVAIWQWKMTNWQCWLMPSWVLCSNAVRSPCSLTNKKLALGRRLWFESTQGGIEFKQLTGMAGLTLISQYLKYTKKIQYYKIFKLWYFGLKHIQTLAFWARALSVLFKFEETAFWG